MKSKWENVPMVTIYRAACPYCGSESYIPVRTFQNGDDSSTRRVVCSACSRRYIVVREPLPKFGEYVTWPDTIQVNDH